MVSAVRSWNIGGAESKKGTVFQSLVFSLSILTFHLVEGVEFIMESNHRGGSDHGKRRIHRILSILVRNRDSAHHAARQRKEYPAAQ